MTDNVGDLDFCSLPITTGSKRVREDEDEDDEEESRPESSHTTPTTKKLRLKAMMALQVNMTADAGPGEQCSSEKKITFNRKGFWSNVFHLLFVKLWLIFFSGGVQG